MRWYRWFGGFVLMMEAKAMVLAHCQPIGFVLMILSFSPK